MRRSKAPSNRLVQATFQNNLESKATASAQSYQSSPPITVDPDKDHQGTTSIVPADNFRTVYSVVWGKRTAKKHKSFPNDGTLIIDSGQAILKDLENSIVCTAAPKWGNIESGTQLIIGSNEVQVVDHLSGPIIQSATNDENKHESSNENSSKVPDEPKLKRKKTSHPSVFKPNLVIASTAMPANKSILQNKEKLTVNIEYKPLVLPRPSEKHQAQFNAFGADVIDVTVMGSLARELRPHQRIGVSFMYECLMGFRHLNSEPYFGCILADEMGLGKTLQCITVCYTLLKQSPYGGTTANKILIVTPSSLVDNWNKEIRKWLGRERAYTFQIDGKNRPHHFAATNHVPFLLISYEMLAKSFDELERVRFDIIVCDEGHRLKNSNVKVAVSLDKFPCRRRIILTGTPIQNDLQEFYSLINFVNPGILGEYSHYKRTYETPIVLSQQPNALQQTKDFGAARARDLNEITKSFVLRRTQEVNNQYLPEKQELVVFCKPSELQQELIHEALKYYEEHLSDRRFDDVTPFHIITTLKKICNHPSLLTIGTTTNSLLHRLQPLIPACDQMGPFDSGKLFVLQNMLHALIEKREKIVLVSYFTKTLNMFQELLAHFGYKFCRLDGTTQSSARLQIVERFNDRHNDTFVFLLSAKAGGVGLNLTGASRLVLFDNDWNPSSDLQAMSRIWRDGQRSSVYIYRLITNGTIEEKIFQRQISKTSLGSCVVDQRSADTTPKLSNDELRDLFTIQECFETCSTHDLLGCGCLGSGAVPMEELSHTNQSPTNDAAKAVKMNELMLWEHHQMPFSDILLDEMCLQQSAGELIFIFRNLCNTKN